jgi:hypothetical protein
MISIDGIDPKEKILEMYLSGFTRDEISQSLGKSQGFVSGVLKASKVQLDENDVKYIHQLGSKLRPKNYPWSLVLDAVGFLGYCDRSGFDIEALKDVVFDLKKKGIRPEDLRKNIHDSAEFLPVAKKDAETLRAEIGVLKQKKVQLLADSAHTEESITGFRKLSDFLTQQKLSPDVPDKLVNIINNFEESNWNIQQIMEKIQATNSLKSDLGRLEDEIKEQADRNKVLDGMLNEKDIQVKHKSELIRNIEQIEKMGFDDAALNSIGNVLRRISDAHGISVQDAAIEFKNDILARYELAKGLEMVISDKKDEERRLDESITRLKSNTSKYHSAIHILKSLDEKGVKPSDVIEIKFIIEDQQYDLTALKDQVLLFGGLDQTLANLRKNIEALQKEKTEIQTSVEALRNEKVAIQKALDSNSDQLHNSLCELDQAIQQTTNLFRKSSTGLSAQAQSLSDHVQVALGKVDTYTKGYVNRQGILLFAPFVEVLSGGNPDLNVLVENIKTILGILLGRMPTTDGRRHMLEYVLQQLEKDPAFAL